MQDNQDNIVWANSVQKHYATLNSQQCLDIVLKTLGDNSKKQYVLDIIKLEKYLAEYGVLDTFDTENKLISLLEISSEVIITQMLTKVKLYSTSEDFWLKKSMDLFVSVIFLIIVKESLKKPFIITDKEKVLTLSFDTIKKILKLENLFLLEQEEFPVEFLEVKKQLSINISYVKDLFKKDERKALEQYAYIAIPLIRSINNIEKNYS
jgi:hypothetical protein